MNSILKYYYFYYYCYCYCCFYCQIFSNGNLEILLFAYKQKQKSSDKNGKIKNRKMKGYPTKKISINFWSCVNQIP